MPRRYIESKRRKEGKKFTEWVIRVEGKPIKVPVRAIKGDLFWVDMPEYKINMRNSDIQELKEQVTEALKAVKTITWEDVLVFTFECEDDDFPTVSVDSKQNGIDEEGNKVRREGQGSESKDGHYVSGMTNHWRNYGFQVVMPKTKENQKLVDQIMKSAGGFDKQIADLFGVTGKGGLWSAKQENVDKALKKVRAGGVEFTAKIGKAKPKKSK